MLGIHIYEHKNDHRLSEALKEPRSISLALNLNVFRISLSAEIAELYSTFRLNRLVYQELNENILMLMNAGQK